ncbi:MAG: pyridoxamine 5'-phosphate oxidase family protein [Pseudomonadota bacterium]
MTTILTDSMRALQDQFETRRLADRVHARGFHGAFTDADRSFIEGAMFFFLATVDADGQPQCSYKGGPKGFVRVTGPSELSFPVYEGNGLYLSIGNIVETGKVGLLFIDFEKQTRIRVNGVARADADHPMLSEVAAAQMVIRVAVTDIHPNCLRNVHRMAFVEASAHTPESAAEDVGKAPWNEAYEDVLPDYMKPDEMR